MNRSTLLLGSQKPKFTLQTIIPSLEVYNLYFIPSFYVLCFMPSFYLCSEYDCKQILNIFAVQICLTWFFLLQITEWGRMSLCDAERRLLANALLDISNERFILVSESCIPLFNFTVIYDYLVKSKYSYMGAFDDKGPFGRGRYNPSMQPEVNIEDWRKGSQWFEVNRKLAVAIVEDTKFYPKFEQFCRPACYVDEHYFPTLLTIRTPNLLANRTITWVDWSRGGPHPATFGKADITEEFLTRIRQGHNCEYNNQPSSVCFLFARKFAPNTLDPLLKFAPKILEL
ncbi:hypothetical protein MKW94_019342 [Papaver nudicaule]|uniref:Core-2/I-branching beta-1,6-N-acetylglucosaminyltransferase family protein n=1 Tax=Papaver nudicaule TaxID=74823 RepID=A0AA41S0J2_PAPNU|nr:hypothetical protein [Papaver nudicaule]